MTPAERHHAWRQTPAYRAWLTGYNALRRARRAPRTSLLDEPTLFWARVDRSGDGCWLWLGRKAGNGYGLIRGHRGDRQVPAHRHALALSLGRALRPDELACHRCDVPLCCMAAKRRGRNQHNRTMRVAA